MIALALVRSPEHHPVHASDVTPLRAPDQPGLVALVPAALAALQRSRPKRQVIITGRLSGRRASASRQPAAPERQHGCELLGCSILFACCTSCMLAAMYLGLITADKHGSHLLACCSSRSLRAAGLRALDPSLLDISGRTNVRTFLPSSTRQLRQAAAKMRALVSFRPRVQSLLGLCSSLLPGHAAGTAGSGPRGPGEPRWTGSVPTRRYLTH